MRKPEVLQYVLCENGKGAGVKMIKQDCFAMRQDKPECMLLNGLYCKYIPCSFYKSKEQFVADREKYAEKEKAWKDEHAAK